MEELDARVDFTARVDLTSRAVEVRWLEGVVLCCFPTILCLPTMFISLNITLTHLILFNAQPRCSSNPYVRV